MKRTLFRILYFPYKWLIFVPYTALSTLFFGSLAILLAPTAGQRFAGYFCGALWARLIGMLTPIVVTVEGRENVNLKQSYVIVANHQSFYDILLVYGWLRRDIRWVMKQELRKVPGLGIGSQMVGHIFIDRSDPASAMASIDAAKKKITNGTCVVFFPEGTRSTTGEIGTFKKGAFRMAFELNIPILPITIIGTKDILPNSSTKLFPGRAKMVIHPPIDITKYSPIQMQQLMDDVKVVIKSG